MKLNPLQFDWYKKMDTVTPNAAPEVSAHQMWMDNISKLEAEISKAEGKKQENLIQLKQELLALKMSFTKTQVYPLNEQNFQQKQMALQDQTPFLTKGQSTTLSAANAVKAIAGSLTVKSPEETFDINTIGSSMADQKFLQRIGMQSNCNVVVQSRRLAWNIYPSRTAYRLYCDVCEGSKIIDDATTITNQRHDDPMVVEFCKLHRHSTEAPVTSTTEGRKFKDAN